VAEFDGHAEVLDDDALRARFPDLRVPPGHIGVLQKDALIVNPRSLVRAELTLATRRGAELVRAEVIGLEPSSTGVLVRTRHGSVEGDLVVLATGAFTNACGLLSRRIDMMVFGCTIVLLEVDDPSQYDLPTLMPYVMSEGCQYAGIIVPPLTYPDGRSYIKGTGADLLSVPLESYEDIESWVRTGGSEAERDHFIDVFRTLLPAVQFGRVLVRPCLPSMNASGLPYIDFVDDRVVLATEGSRGVMMADEIGRLTARLAVKGRWDDPLPGELFRIGSL
jgi:glycine/D-amino acid oxidase-like deaminating enzyme